jgi:dTDP-4-dehydrorhamnose 3,5-epimerase
MMDLNNFNSIDGVYIKELKQFSDERGSVLHMIKSTDNHFKNFGEIYFSEVLPGKVKAWKFHKIQNQNLVVPVGKILFVIYDNRLNSPTYNNILKIEMGRPDSYFLLHVPSGLWYGFKCIGNSNAILVNCADTPYDSNECQTKNSNDNFVNFNWADLND